MRISARDSTQLLVALGEIDIAVPPRDDGRTTEHCERWSICRFLSTYAETPLIQYPFHLEKRERPDFLLSLDSKLVGLEVTEAVPPAWAWANAKRGELGFDEPMFLQEFVPAEPQRSKDEIIRIARGTESGDGWQATRPNDNGRRRCCTLQ